MKLSYAQNMEDHTLAKVFAGEPPGVYIDIGGGPPVADNVTYWFYLQGWHGLVVEPQARIAASYAGIRPRDIVESVLVGAAAGEGVLHEVARFHGFSTMLRGNAERAAGFGASFTERTLPVVTLADLCARHAIAAADLLKIDVEGAEADVIGGADWARFRPRVLCIEAVEPGSMAPAWHGWEPMLLAAGYRFTLFDGLNRFYVAEEAPALAARFPNEKGDWGAVGHLYDFGRPLAGPRHADHDLAEALVDGFLAELPALEPALLLRLLRASGRDLASETLARLVLGDPALLDPPAALPPLPGDASDAMIAALLASDPGRAALGRIACFHDGGHIVEE